MKSKRTNNDKKNVTNKFHSHHDSNNKDTNIYKILTARIEKKYIYIENRTRLSLLSLIKSFHTKNNLDNS